MQLETLFVDVINDMLVMFKDEENLCKKHGLSQIELLEKKELLTQQMNKIFTVIKRDKSFAQLQEDLKKGRRASILSEKNQPEELSDEDESEELEKDEVDHRSLMTGLILGLGKRVSVEPVKEEAVEEI